MVGGKRIVLFCGLGVLLALAGCGRSMLLQGERPSWRHQAEVQCMQSGAVKIGTGVVQVSPIEGPGMCGADFPLKVAALGESGSSLGYSDIPRPPASVRNGSQPNWPPTQARYDQPYPPQQPAPRMQWVPGAPAVNAPQVTAPQVTAPREEEPRYSAPSYNAPQVSPPQSYNPQGYNQQGYARQAYPPQDYRAPAGRPVSLDPQYGEPQRDDIPDDAVLPQQKAPPPSRRMQPAYNAPVYVPPPQQRSAPPALGPMREPMRGPAATGAILPATLKPAATLSCPIVSALDRWVSAGVQPAAFHWFGTQVVEIKQISAYSCRGMVGNSTAHISEHAFGNALDVAGFVFADGRKIMVKDGWHGSPEEQGFLHDVQLYACETFTTVLAPGYNAAHYNHIHVDLMRRTSGRRPCRPNAIPGEVVAAKLRAVYASRHRAPNYTGSISSPRNKAPEAVPGADGYVADEDGDEAVTGSISQKATGSASAVAGEDGEFDDEDVTGSIGGGWPRTVAPSRPAPQYTPAAEDRQSHF
jgi:hypothetical protein